MSESSDEGALFEKLGVVTRSLQEIENELAGRLDQQAEQNKKKELETVEKQISEASSHVGIIQEHGEGEIQRSMAEKIRRKREKLQKLIEKRKNLLESSEYAKQLGTTEDIVETEELDISSTDDEVSIGAGRAIRDLDSLWIDDGDLNAYVDRLDAFKENSPNGERTLLHIFDNSANTRGQRISVSNVEYEGEYSLSREVSSRLFRYQEKGIKWLWELHKVGAGGIVGDEMGLGKTVMVAAFLSGLDISGLFEPSIIVVPTTLLRQWVAEFHVWWPKFRVCVFHDSGSFKGPRDELVEEVLRNGDILVTTYEMLRRRAEEIVTRRWQYVILDEGHKIRNPDADITICCKMFNTTHRLLLSGSPIQNRLNELWSLFDFVVPGKLGTLPAFEAQFIAPIINGGYASATRDLVRGSYEATKALKDLIAPYILRRSKKKVNLKLPNITERILFCRLTSEQLAKYNDYVTSQPFFDIISLSGEEGNRNLIFRPIQYLRRLCNHPEVGEEDFEEQLKAPNFFDFLSRSGKLVVLLELLNFWHRNGDKVLIFSQSKDMLKIIQRMMTFLNYRHLIMTGETRISERNAIVNKFNRDERIFAFLLTTRVGGLGLNLTGANRIAIIDPDWNPSTDLQAQERAWRIGQSRDVLVLRFVTAGTIEEKIYHRQIYKLLLASRVLGDRWQFNRNFSYHSLANLFDLVADNEGPTESAELIRGSLEVRASSKSYSLSSSNTMVDTAAPNSEHEETVSKDEEGDILLNDILHLPELKSVFMRNQKGEIEGDDEFHVEESRRAAKEAVIRLSKLKKRRDDGDVGIPTWTGRRGEFGAPQQSNQVLKGLPVFGQENSRKLEMGTDTAARFSAEDRKRSHISSQSILGAVKKRKAESPWTKPDTRADTLASDIRDFLLEQPRYKCKSEQIVKKFRGTTKHFDLYLMKDILTNLCEFDRNQEGEGVWILKPGLREREILLDS